MRARDVATGALILLATLARPASAQDAPEPMEQNAAGPIDPDAPMPSGHPHVPTASNAPPGVFEPPPDTVEEDAKLPAGTIAITILDPDGKPRPHVPVTLGVVQQSIAKGESRKHLSGETDAEGNVAFSNLEHGSGFAYRVTVAKDGATFAASPFNLPPAKGMRVGLHVYPVTRDINQALIVMQYVLYAEMKDDRVQLQQAVSVYNFGRVAWVPDDVVIALPEGFTALNGQQEMSDVGIDPIDKRGARLRGTMSPGRHDVEFRWQLPYDGAKDVTFDVAVPPHTAVLRVMSVASQQMKLVVPGLPEAEPHTDNQGQRILVSEKQMRRDDPPMKTLHVEIRDLPTAGPAKWIATFLSFCAVVVGIAIAAAGRTSANTAKGPTKKAERAQILADLEELERAHKSGEVGPKTYERARRELIDALARALARDEPARAKAPSPAGA